MKNSLRPPLNVEMNAARPGPPAEGVIRRFPHWVGADLLKWRSPVNLSRTGSREAGKPGSREAGKPGSRGSREAGKPGSREAGKPGSREALVPSVRLELCKESYERSRGDRRTRS